MGKATKMDSGKVDVVAAEGFDLEAWISSARLPERSVELCSRGDLLADHQHLEQRLKDVLTEERRNPTELMMGQRLASHDLAQQVRRLEAELADAMRTFRVRAVTGPEQQELQEKSAKDDKGELDFDDWSARWLAVSTVSPEVTPEQVKKLRRVLGDGQYLQWWNASSVATNDRVTVPFSPAASAALRTQESSTT